MLVYTSIYWYIPACTSTYHQDFWVLCCTALYCVVSTNGFQQSSVSESTVHADMLVYTSIFWYILYTSMYQHRPINQLTSTVCTDWLYMLVCTELYWYVLVCASMCWYVLVCAGMYQSRSGFKNGANQARIRDLLHNFHMLHRCTARVQTPNT